jgi:hypothetical protein
MKAETVPNNHQTSALPKELQKAIRCETDFYYIPLLITRRQRASKQTLPSIVTNLGAECYRYHMRLEKVMHNIQLDT